jgi:hypothetical protein
MKKKLIITVICLTAILVPLFGSGIVGAADESMPAAKTAAVSECVSVTSENWQKLGDLDLSIKTGAPKDLVISVSLESSLFTLNKISGRSKSQAEAEVDVMVKVNGEPVMVCDNYGDRRDAIVVFNRRLVELSGDLSHHITVTGGDVTVEIDDHWIQFFMETKSANSFNFIARDVGPNISTVEIYVRAWSDTFTAGDPDAQARAAAVLGHASVIVDEVNLKDS